MDVPTQAVLPGGPRLSDYLSIGVLAQVYPIASVREALASCGRGSRRQRALPAEAMVYYVVALGLFRSVSAREVLRCLMEGLRWVSSDAALRVSGKSSISRARTRLGPGPFEALRAARGEAGGGAGDTRGVVSRPALGGVRRVDVERAGRGGEPGDFRGARGVAWPRCLPAGAPERHWWSWARGRRSPGERARMANRRRSRSRRCCRGCRRGCSCWRTGAIAASCSGDGRRTPAPTCCGA